MKIYRSIAEPIRQNAKWDERWNSDDDGLIACWERGREKRLEAPALAAQAVDGQLIVLPWKGGVEKATKKKRKYGTLFYLAMWQGLRATQPRTRARCPGRNGRSMSYKVNGSAEMTDTSLVRAHGDSRRLGASPPESMVRESSVTLVSGASRIPFERSSRFRRFPWRCRS